MNRISINTIYFPLPPWSCLLTAFAKKVLEEIGKDKWDLSVLLCSDETIKKFNSQYRGKNQPTDVLAFSMEEGEQFPSGKGKSFLMPGDIIISLDTLSKNARRSKISEDEELRRLLIHGILHLNGMDHIVNDSMIQLQEQILAKLNNEKILESNI